MISWKKRTSPHAGRSCLRSLVSSNRCLAPLRKEADEPVAIFVATV